MKNKENYEHELLIRVQYTKRVIKVLIFAFTLLIGMDLFHYKSNMSHALKNVTLPDITFKESLIEGMNRKELNTIFQKDIDSLNYKKIYFLIDNKKESLTYEQLGVFYKPQDLIDKTLKHQSNFNWNSILSKPEIQKSKKLSLIPTINDDQLSISLQQHFSKYNTEPNDIHISIKNPKSQLEILKNEGRIVDMLKLKDDVLFAINNNHNTVSVSFIHVQPKISIGDIKK